MVREDTSMNERRTHVGRRGLELTLYGAAAAGAVLAFLALLGVLRWRIAGAACLCLMLLCKFIIHRLEARRSAGIGMVKDKTEIRENGDTIDS